MFARSVPKSPQPPGAAARTVTLKVLLLLLAQPGVFDSGELRSSLFAQGVVRSELLLIARHGGAVGGDIREQLIQTSNALFLVGIRAELAILDS